MIIIGGVHGKLKEYWDIIHSIPNQNKTIQVGDFGFSKEHFWHHHSKRREEVNCTTFICIDELETIDLEELYYK